MRVLQVPKSTIPNQGKVEFVTYYKRDHQVFCLHEMSLFEKQEGRWYYVDGLDSQLSTKGEPNFVMPCRNDPCYCGRGKKFKKPCDFNI